MSKVLGIKTGGQVEEWRDVAGYEGRYQISNMGRVKSLERKVNSGNNAWRIIKEKILKTGKDKDGYEVVTLCIACHEKICKVHRLVAEAFIPRSLKEKNQINHKDYNKLNNSLENLEWICAQENNTHREKGKARKGYAFYPGKKKPYRSKIIFKNKLYHLGFFTTKEEAQEAYSEKYKIFYGEEPILK